MDELRGDQDTAVDKLGKRIEEEAAGVRADKDEAERQIEDIRSALAEVSTQAVSLDTLSVLRQLRPLLAGDGSTEAPGAGKEHGHAVLMARLVEEARRQPERLAGKTLVEVGSTRERDPFQGSTEKLAIFTGLAAMQFVTVDMDPNNTGRAARVIEHLNPSARAVNERGEHFLSTWTGRLDYVYLDAFDFDHGGHSEERQARYRDILGTEISDDDCWRMHERCAVEVVKKMPRGGVVVIDDTWLDEDGNYCGKGKLAVPLLVASGFDALPGAPRVVALKRTTGSDHDS
jgi:plasmid stability protein